MPSARRHTHRAGAVAVCGLLLAGVLAGCTTTQETAARKQAESKRILEAREARKDRRSKLDKTGEQR